VQKSEQESEVYRHSVLKGSAGNAGEDMLLFLGAGQGGLRD
jgi:hypothetical protein